MHETVAYLYHYLSTNWDTIGVYLLGGAGVSAVVKLVDRLRNWQKGYWRELAVGIVAGLGAISDWIINNYHTSPLATLGNVGARLYVAAILMHRILVNPLTKLVENNLVQNYKDLKAYQAEKAANPAIPNEFV